MTEPKAYINLARAFLGWRWYVIYRGKFTNFQSGRSLTKNRARRESNAAFRTFNREQRGV